MFNMACLGIQMNLTFFRIAAYVRRQRRNDAAKNSGHFKNFFEKEFFFVVTSALKKVTS